MSTERKMVAIDLHTGIQDELFEAVRAIFQRHGLDQVEGVTYGIDLAARLSCGVDRDGRGMGTCPRELVDSFMNSGLKQGLDMWRAATAKMLAEGAEGEAGLALGKPAGRG